MDIRFLVDTNVGKLARCLRLLGYDAKLFLGTDDGRMIAQALREGRVVLTKDTQIFQRRVFTMGHLKALLVQGDEPVKQLQQVVAAFNLDYNFKPFSRCLECNQPLVRREREEVKDLVPPYVFQTQTEFRQCPSCRRLYWQGTHWHNMSQEMKRWQVA